MCSSCGQILRRFDTDRQPLTSIIVGLIFLPFVVSIIVALLLAPTLGAVAFVLPVLSGPFCYAINLCQFPYTNGFEIWHPRCEKCTYDMPGVEGFCPECGGQPEQPPNE